MWVPKGQNPGGAAAMGFNAGSWRMNKLHDPIMPNNMPGIMHMPKDLKDGPKSYITKGHAQESQEAAK